MLLNRIRSSSKRFFVRNDGGMIILAVFLFVAMLFTASLAIDLVRHDQERVRLQGIADRAVLSAATIPQDEPGNAEKTKQFVSEFFLAAGYTSAQVDEWVEVIPIGDTGAEVRVTPRASLPTLLMRLIGVDDLALNAPAAARVATGYGRKKMEIVLVLDISGSMSRRTSNGLTRLENLRHAAAALVEDLMRDREVGDVAISIAPYESWVMLDNNLLNAMPNSTGTGMCADFSDWNEIADFRGTGGRGNSGLGGPPAFVNPPGLARANAVRNSTSAQINRVNCGTSAGYNNFRRLEMLMTDKTTILNRIQSLQTMGTTSIDLGLRYGAMLFDEGLRPYVSNEITAGRIHHSMQGRPAGVDDEEVMRFMLIMTDGENCCGARGSAQQLDDNTRAVCDNLRVEGIPVFAVAFEAPQRGADLMNYCASSDGHYFNSSGEGLTEAFQSIGRQITIENLRLIE